MNDTLQFALPVGTVLKDGEREYEIVETENAEGFLGQGGFGITYLSKERPLNRFVAIKEFFPSSIVSRGQTLRVASRDQDQFSALKKYFLEEARMLARFEDSRIVSVLGFFEENNTAYMVMPFLSGETLEDRYKKHALSEEKAKSLMLELLRALQQVHQRGVLHRDIKPSNIKFDVQTDVPILIDFGSARVSDGSSGTTTVGAYSPHFSPLELNSTNTQKTPATDIYALAATIYRAMFQSGPPDAAHRFEHDDDALPELDAALADGSVSKDFAAVLRRCLELRGRDRFQSLAEVEEAILAIGKPDPIPTPVLKYALAAILAVGVIGGGVRYATQPDSEPTPEVAVADEPPSTRTAAEIAALQRARDDDAWDTALQAGTLSAFQAYLLDFPQGRHAGEAQDGALWSRAQQARTPDAIRDYLASCDMCLFQNEADSLLRSLDSSAWELANRQNSQRGFEDYLAEFPDGRHAGEAQASLAELIVLAAADTERAADQAAWERALATNTEDGFQEYLNARPNGQYRDESQALIEALRAERAAAERLVAADTAAWQRAELSDTLGSYQAYLAEYANGLFRIEAEDAIERLNSNFLAAANLSLDPETNELVAECDRLAGSSYFADDIAPHEPTAFSEIDHDAAIQACEAAVEAFPEHSRSTFHLARAIHSTDAETSTSLAVYLSLCERNDDVASGACASAGDILRTEESVRDYARAQGLLERGCEMADGRGSGSSCNLLGIMHLNGEGDLEEDLVQAVTYYEQACELGEPWGCSNGGNILRTEESVRDYARAQALLERGCEMADGKGSGSSCNLLGIMHRNGEGDLEEDLVQAVTYYEQACELGEPWGCSNGGNILRTEESVRDYARAQALLERGCEMADGKGSGSSCNLLGIMHRNGEGDLEEDLVQAVTYYEQACELGEPWGCSNGGNILRTEESVRDYARAQALLERGCEMADGKGSGSSCNRLGIMHRNGEGDLEEDLVQAVTYYEQACELGEPWGCSNGGNILRTEETVRDYARAQGLLERGCEMADGRGSAHSCRSLGQMQWYGEGLNPDRSLALDLYVDACDLGDEAGCEVDHWLYALEIEAESAFVDFLNRYPNGLFSAAANARLGDHRSFIVDLLDLNDDYSFGYFNWAPEELISIPSPSGPQPDMLLSLAWSGESLQQYAAQTNRLSTEVVDAIGRCSEYVCGPFEYTFQIADILRENIAQNTLDHNPSLPDYGISRQISRVRGWDGAFALLDRYGFIIIVDENGYAISMLHSGLVGRDLRNWGVADAVLHGSELFLSITEHQNGTDGSVYKYDLSADRATAELSWISPSQSSDTSIALTTNYVLSAFGGPDRADYLFQIRRDSGSVEKRHLFETVIMDLFYSSEQILLQRYGFAEVYRFRE